MEAGQQPAASLVPSPTANHADEIRPAAPSSTVGICGTASAPAVATAVSARAAAAGVPPHGASTAVAATETAAVGTAEAAASPVAALTPGSRDTCADSGGLTCSSGGDDGIYGFERGASYPFDPGGLFAQEVREEGDHISGGKEDRSSGGRSSSSGDSGDGAAWHGASTHPFDRGKRFPWRRATRGPVLGADLPFDRGKDAWAHAGG
ncbi:unnamed protein product [Ectocarpus sp. CCAP 1310/34]|nr:unnamed protein product [Ectocarpus sp. CCAP 1310/34]